MAVNLCKISLSGGSMMKILNYLVNKSVKKLFILSTQEIYFKINTPCQCDLVVLNQQINIDGWQNLLLSLLKNIFSFSSGNKQEECSILSIKVISKT